MIEDNLGLFFLITLIWNIIFWAFFSWRFVYYINPKQLKKEIENITNSSEIILDKNCGGKIGMMNFSIGTLRVQISDKGIILKPIIMPNSYINPSEVSYFKSIPAGLSPKTEIVHTSPYIKSPVIIYTEVNEDIKDFFKT